MEYVYILECADGTLYTGWTNDLTARLAAHNSGRGAKYTRGRAPVKLAFSEVFDDRSEALGYEAALKKLTRTEKLNLIAGRRAADGEYLTVLDEQGRACGDQPRTVVHRQGCATQSYICGYWKPKTVYRVCGSSAGRSTVRCIRDGTIRRRPVILVRVSSRVRRLCAKPVRNAVWWLNRTI